MVALHAQTSHDDEALMQRSASMQEMICRHAALWGAWLLVVDHKDVAAVTAR